MASIPESGPLAAFLKYGCPGIGTGIALLVFLSPLPTALAVAKRGYLGDVNALPFAMMAANCAAWMFYGAFIADYFVYVANIPGLVGGLFYTLVCFRFSKAAAQNALTAIALASAILFSLVGVADMAVASPSASKTLWGATAVGVLGLFYSAPLATLGKVIRERSSSSLHWPLCLTNALNGSLWFAYGLAVRDMFICAPNGVGAFFNLVCLAFCVAFPRREAVGGAAGGGAGAGAGAGTSAAKNQAVPDLVGGNWGGLRIQSVRFPAPLPDLLGPAAAAARASAAADASGSSPGSASPQPSSSSSRPLPPAAAAAGAPGGGSFLDLAAMRWRTGRSFLNLPPQASAPSRPRNGGGGGGFASALPPAAAAEGGGANGSRIALVSRGAAGFLAAGGGDEEAGGGSGGLDAAGPMRSSSVIDRPIRESGEQD